MRRRCRVARVPAAHNRATDQQSKGNGSQFRLDAMSLKKQAEPAKDDKPLWDSIALVARTVGREIVASTGPRQWRRRLRSARGRTSSRGPRAKRLSTGSGGKYARPTTCSGNRHGTSDRASAWEHPRWGTPLLAFADNGFWWRIATYDTKDIGIGDA